MKDSLKSWGEALFEALIILIVLFFVLFPVKVDGFSMEDTLNDGDMVCVSRVMAYAGMYGRGDLVVFKHGVGGNEIKMVKRVIAVGGDTVEIKDGNIYINGELLEEEYASEDIEGDVLFAMEDNEIYVLGDNRESSVDSRAFGPINKKEITARVVMKFYPFSDISIYW